MDPVDIHRIWSRLSCALPLAGYVLLAIVLSWPLVLHLDTHVLGDPAHPGLRGDLFFQYNLQQQMADGHWPTHRHTLLLAWPDGLTIDARVAFSQFMLAYVALMSVLDLLTSRNLAGLAFLVLDAFAMHLLIRHVVRRESYAWLGGFLFGFGPFIFLKVDQGFVQKTCLFLVPLFLLFLWRALVRGRRLDQGLAVACMVGTLSMYPPYGVFTLITGVLLVAGEAASSRNPRLLLWRSLPVALGALAAFVWIAVAIHDDPRPVAMAMDPGSWRQLGGYLDVIHPFRWLPYRDTFDHHPTPAIPLLPLGLPVLLSGLAAAAAVVGSRRERVWVAGVAAMLVVMIGPYLPVGGRPTDLDTTLVPMPFLLLGQLPMGSVLKFPIRLYPFALILLLLAAPAAVTALQRALRARPPLARFAALAFPAVALLSIVETRLVFPEYSRFEVAELQAPRFYDQVRDEDFDALLLLPPDPLVSNDYVYVTVLSGKSLLNGYLEQPGGVDIPRNEASDEDKRMFIHRLGELRVGYIVLYPAALGAVLPSGGGRPKWPIDGDPYGWLATYLGMPMLFPEDGFAVYELPSR